MFRHAQLAFGVVPDELLAREAAALAAAAGGGGERAPEGCVQGLLVAAALVPSCVIYYDLSRR
jgi:hypothetical protein